MRKSLLVAMGSAMLCLALVACGSSQTGAGEGGATTQPANTFEGRVPRDSGKITDLVDKAASNGKELLDKATDGAEDQALGDELKERFVAANELYRNGDYAGAEKAYREILEKNPLHYGANVNLVLALVQQEHADEAFDQALLCAYVFEGSVGVAINAQVAGVAAGYDVDVVEYALTMIAEAAGSDFGKMVMDSQYADAYTYNLLWDRVDTRLHDAATGESSAKTDDAAQEDDAAKAEKDAAASTEAVEAADEGITSQAAKDPAEEYRNLRNALAELLEKSPDDKDVQALITYCEGAGKKIGAEGGDADADTKAEDAGPDGNG